MRQDEASFQRRHGCNHAQWRSIIDHPSKPRMAFKAQKSTAKQRGVAWELKLWDWWTLWQESGQWENRGRGSGQYVMCRKGDIGPYAVGNVYIATSRHNASSKRIERKTDLPTGVVRAAHNQTNPFAAHRCIEGKTVYLGYFPTPELAHDAYLAADPDRGAA